MSKQYILYVILNNHPNLLKNKIAWPSQIQSPEKWKHLLTRKRHIAKPVLSFRKERKEEKHLNSHVLEMIASQRWTGSPCAHCFESSGWPKVYILQPLRQYGTPKYLRSILPLYNLYYAKNMKGQSLFCQFQPLANA